MPSEKPIIGIRGKLIAIFILIKILPLVLLGWVAWEQAKDLVAAVSEKGGEMAHDMRQTVKQAGKLAVADSIEALDLRSREAVERLTTDTAKQVADFLYQRDNDIAYAATLPMTEEAFRNFLTHKKRPIIEHEKWVLNKEETGWVRAQEKGISRQKIAPLVKENKKDFHHRPAELMRRVTKKPLYLEMTFIGLDGQERVKVTTSDVTKAEMTDVSDRKNTWIKAEDYFTQVQNLKNGEIYVSNVIGAYVPSKVIGPYTPAKAKKAGIPFEPEKSGYAGKENPVGKKFQGLVRWVTPVFQDGVKTGYVSLALDHTHLMEFTDHVVPTEERYSAISDAASGNYAFMWDNKGRNISHPRDYFIVGYDPETGDPEVPWLSASIYELWQKNGGSWGQYVKEAPTYLEPGGKNKPAVPLIKQGRIALDCRYLNFAPQCFGWDNLTQEGGSGSFVIFWSGLWKLTTVATIPYYTGQYKNSARGFGYVTIGANVDEFHKAATETGKRLEQLIQKQDDKAEAQQAELISSIHRLFKEETQELTLYTLIMIVIVVVIAIWMASFLTDRVKILMSGFDKFKKGDLSARLEVASNDELGQLSSSFNQMASGLQKLINSHALAREQAEEASRAKTIFLANMSHELRTPLNAILGFSDVIRHQIFGPVGNEKYQNYAEDIHQSGNHLLEIISDILDLARINSGQEEISNEAFSMSEVIQASLGMVKKKAADGQLELTSELDPTMPIFSGDRRKVKQMLLNLLSNAIKFSPEGGKVLVKANMTLDGALVVTVSDQGIGMTPEQIEVALSPFGHVDNTIDRKYQGTGLGLPLTKSFIELHGGSLRVESEPGKGTVCSLVFPRSMASA